MAVNDEHALLLSAKWAAADVAGRIPALKRTLMDSACNHPAWQASFHLGAWHSSSHGGLHSRVESNAACILHCCWRRDQCPEPLTQSTAPHGSWGGRGGDDDVRQGFRGGAKVTCLQLLRQLLARLIVCIPLCSLHAALIEQLFY